MTISIRTIVLGVVLATGVAMPVAAQDIGLGYQFQRISGGGESETLPLGFNIDASVPFGQGNLSVVGQFDWSRKTESDSFEGLEASSSLSLSTFGAGVRWSGTTNPQATPFVQGLVGASKYSIGCEIEDIGLGDLCDAFAFSETKLMVQFGGGVALPVNDRVGIVGQVDFRRIFTEGEGTNSIRFVGGVRVKL